MYFEDVLCFPVLLLMVVFLYVMCLFFPPLATFFFKINLFYLFIYLWLHWVFVAARRLSLVVANRGYSSLWCVGFSLQWILLLLSTGSRHVGLSSCGTRALECMLGSCGALA